MRRIGTTHRIALAFAGLASWVAGGAASFLSSNGAGAAALVAAGGICGVLGLMGRWPSRISMSGNEVLWESVERTVSSQIEIAAKSDEGETVLAELRNLRERLTILQETGSVPEHPAQRYDEAVQAAISRMVPGAQIIRQQVRDRAIADFVVRYRGTELFVETKWRADPTQPFGGSTLPQLIQGLPPDAKLLVLTNTSVPPLPRAYKTMSEKLDGRGRIVPWMDITDDSALGDALTFLLKGTVVVGKS